MSVEKNNLRWIFFCQLENNNLSVGLKKLTIGTTVLVFWPRATLGTSGSSGPKIEKHNFRKETKKRETNPLQLGPHTPP